MSPKSAKAHSKSERSKSKPISKSKNFLWSEEDEDTPKNKKLEYIKNKEDLPTLTPRPPVEGTSKVLDASELDTLLEIDSLALTEVLDEAEKNVTSEIDPRLEVTPDVQDAMNKLNKTLADTEKSDRLDVFWDNVPRTLFGENDFIVDALLDSAKSWRQEARGSAARFKEWELHYDGVLRASYELQDSCIAANRTKVILEQERLCQLRSLQERELALEEKELAIGSLAASTSQQLMLLDDRTKVFKEFVQTAKDDLVKMGTQLLDKDNESWEQVHKEIERCSSSDKSKRWKKTFESLQARATIETQRGEHIATCDKISGLNVSGLERAEMSAHEELIAGITANIKDEIEDKFDEAARELIREEAYQSGLAKSLEYIRSDIEKKKDSQAFDVGVNVGQARYKAKHKELAKLESECKKMQSERSKMEEHLEWAAMVGLAKGIKAMTKQKSNPSSKLLPDGSRNPEHIEKIGIEMGRQVVSHPDFFNDFLPPEGKVDGDDLGFYAGVLEGVTEVAGDLE